MLEFTTPSFAIAGLLAAAGPVIIHLLNRRRHRVVAWGAMDFLREAVKRQRKTLELRDLILLTLRMLMVIALGLGLARPAIRGSGHLGPVALAALGGLILFAVAGAAASVIWRERRLRLVAGAVCGAALLGLLMFGGWLLPKTEPSWGQATLSGGAVHAILMLDNSRSLGVATAAGTGLDRAKSQAQRFIDQLPPDSRMTLIPLAGAEEPFPRDPFVSKDAARKALDQIRLVDAEAIIESGLEQAEQACRQLPEYPAKRVVIWSDLQANAWSDVDWSTWSARLPDVQIASVAAPEATNLAVERVTLEDGFAGTEAPGRFLVRVSASPTATAPMTTDVTLSVDEATVANQLIELAPGQARDVEFQHHFDVAGEPGRPNWVVATATLTPADPATDQLAADNQLSVAVPVVDAVPVVFIDQFGADGEDVEHSRIGETHALRHLLAPHSSAADSQRRTIRVQHLSVEDVGRDVLETARLVVVGGIESPGELTALLREYVLQGGPLVLLAGGEFDPRRWNAEAWLDGRGILPAPLRPEPVGELPESTAELRPFFADFQTMQNDLFLVEGEDLQSLRGLFETLPFFRAVQVDVAGWSAPDAALSGTGDATPRWWLWRPANRGGAPDEDVAQDAAPPRVLAAFTRGATPWVVERRIGLGRVVFFSSGVSSDWNLLRTSGAMYVFHRLMSRLMSETLPSRNYQPADRVAFPVVAGEVQRHQLIRPTEVAEPLPVEALENGISGVLIRRPLTAGVYRVLSSATEAVTPTATENASTVTFCIQAPVTESDLTVLSPEQLGVKIGDSTARVLAADEFPRVEGGARRGQTLWKWLIAGLVGLLLVEMLVLAKPRQNRGAA
uniref:Aerotolerance regulator N-terminal domain-containing protein n=1 Tax=Schlesneria paludicola TaxID=360056 RepID=A0A7C2P393_9PLAN